MSVPKGKRKKSSQEVFHQTVKVRQAMTELMQRDFGYNVAKVRTRLEQRFQHRPASLMSEAQLTYYNNCAIQLKHFDEYFLPKQKDAILDCLHHLDEEIYLADNLKSPKELEQRNLHVDLSIGYCHYLVQLLQHTIETLPVNRDIAVRYAKEIRIQLNLLEEWR